jgi:Tfp pilus assembly protein PilX
MRLRRSSVSCDRPVVSSIASSARTRRCRGDRGTAFVAALVIMFTVTGVAAIWLARDVNQRVSDRSALQSVAFQAARAGAQQLEVADLRGGGSGALVIDESAARTAARSVAQRLANSYGIDMQVVSQGYGGDQATWTVTLAARDQSKNVVGADLDGVLSAIGIAHAESGG